MTGAGLRRTVRRAWARARAALRRRGWLAPEVLPAGSRITTYNIGRGARGPKGARSGTLDAVAATIAEERPDVVALQEVHEPDVAAIAAALRSAHDLPVHHVFGPALDAEAMEAVVRRARKKADHDGTPFDEAFYRDRVGAFGVALLSRAPLADVRVVRLPGEGEARVALVARTEVEGSDVTVVVTHLATAAHAATRDAQTRAVLALAARVDGPVVLAGDLNQEPDEVAAARRATPEARRLVPATHPDHPTLGGRTIDHVLVDDGTVVVGAKVGDPGVSDHAPVTVAVRPR